MYNILHNFEDARGNKYELVILGACHGVGFIKRGKEDNHLCFKFLVEDDENWSPESNYSSSWWFPKFVKLVEYTEKYMNTNYKICKKTGGGWMLDG